jgi:hypothetical protein
MRHRSIALLVSLLVSFCLTAPAVPFVVFPKASQLVSPNGQLVVRDQVREGAATDFLGTSHSLWLVELATGRSRKICDYTGLAAVAWSNSDFVIVTQYVSRRTSRALVFPVAGSAEPVLLDQPTLIRLVPIELRPTLQENDHVFVEASRLDGSTLYLDVWGYGQHDANGFRWRCEYALQEGTASCRQRGAHPR